MKNKNILSIIYIALLAIGLNFITPSKAFAQYPGQNGRILFIGQTTGDPDDPATWNSRDIYSINPDGSNPLRLTNNNLYDNWPKSSKDGKKIVWYSCNWSGSTALETCEIWIMDFDKPETATKLTDNAYADTQPAFSPDGSRIVFSSRKDGGIDIYSMKTDGTDLVRLTNLASSPNGAMVLSASYGFAGTFASYSPDGSFVYFSRNVALDNSGTGASKFNIWRVSANSTGGANTGLSAVTAGSNTVQCGSTTCPLEDGHPDVSPDGKSIVFHSNRSSIAGQPQKYSIYQLNIESGLPKNTPDMVLVSDTGSGFQNPTGQYALWPTYSPDGTKIVYTRYPGIDAASGTQQHSYMLSVGTTAGSTPSLLTKSIAISAPSVNLEEYASSVSSYWGALPQEPPNPPGPNPPGPVEPSTPGVPNTSKINSPIDPNATILVFLTLVLFTLVMFLAGKYVAHEFVTTGTSKRRR